MADQQPKSPNELPTRRDPFSFLEDATVRGRFVWSTLVTVVLAGLVAVLTTGVLRRLGTLIVELGALVLVLVLSRHPMREKRQVDDDIIRVKTPRQRIVTILQGLLLVIYNVGIMVVVFAALVRFDAIQVSFSTSIQIWFPFMLAAYLVVMALVAAMQLADNGRTESTWYSRMSTAVTVSLGVLVFALAAIMVAFPQFALGSLVVVERDLLVLVLAVILAASTQLFFVAGIPTAYDFIIGVFQKDEGQNDIKVQTPPIVYAALVAIGAVVVIGFIAQRTGLIGLLGRSLASEQGAYILILLPVGLAAFSLYSVINIYREGRTGLYKKRIPTKLRNDILVYGLSSASGILFSFMAFMVVTERWQTVGPFEANTGIAKDLITLTIVTTVGPIGLYVGRQVRRVDNIEIRLPDFLNDLAETRRAGLTLTASLHAAARSDYGPLSEEVRRMSNQVAWGVSFTEALGLFAKRVKSSLVERSSNLIIESSKTGGSVAAIIKAAADDAREIKSLESERRAVLATYLVVIYVTFFVFMTVIAVLDGSFIPQVIEAQQTILTAENANRGGLTSAISSEPLNEEALRFTYFNAAVVQAIGNGLVGGLLLDQRVVSGFRHIAIMTLASWLLFRWILVF